MKLNPPILTVYHERQKWRVAGKPIHAWSVPYVLDLVLYGEPLHTKNPKYRKRVLGSEVQHEIMEGAAIGNEAELAIHHVDSPSAIMGVPPSYPEGKCNGLSAPAIMGGGPVSNDGQPVTRALSTPPALRLAVNNGLEITTMQLAYDAK